MIIFTVQEAKTKFNEVIEKALDGEEIVIEKDESHQVKISRWKKKPFKPMIGCVEGKIHMSDDFDEPLEDCMAERRSPML